MSYGVKMKKLIYGATPMFMIVAENLHRHQTVCWTIFKNIGICALETYSRQNREELLTEQAKWMDIIQPRLPQASNLRILDIGCGPVIFLL